MSEEGSREITVKVEKDSSDLEDEITRLTELLDEKDSLLEAVAQQAFSEEVERLASTYPNYAEKIRNVENPSQLEWIKTFLTGEKTSKSKGVVSLRRSSGESPVFEHGRDWAHYIMKAKNDPTNPYHHQIKQLIREAKSESRDLLQYLPKKIDFSHARDPAIRDLGEKYSWREKVEWDREQARKRAENESRK